MQIESPPCLAWRVRHPRALTQATRAELIRALRACASALAVARAGAAARKPLLPTGANPAYIVEL